MNRAALAWSAAGLLAALLLPWYALQEGLDSARLALPALVVGGLRQRRRQIAGARQMVAGAGRCWRSLRGLALACRP